MDRRAFLTGLIASGAMASCPIVVEIPISSWRTWFEQLHMDMISVFVQVWEDQLLFGVGAYETCAVYPYIRRIDPATLEPPILRGGLF